MRNKKNTEFNLEQRFVGLIFPANIILTNLFKNPAKLFDLEQIYIEFTNEHGT